MTRRGHVPQRQCAGCGERFAKRALVRFTVIDAEKREAVLDPRGKAGGRGVYLCARDECLERALKRKVLQHRLRATAVSPQLRNDFMCLLERRERG